MSVLGIKSVLIKAISDSEFYNLLFSQPEKALIGFDLSEAETSRLLEINRQQFDRAIGEMAAHRILPMRAGERIWVCPADIHFNAPDGDVLIQLDQTKTDIGIKKNGEPHHLHDEAGSALPGKAFGSGMHPTTRLCISALEDYLAPGYRVLDIGTGSGILAIAAAKLGASSVLGLDVDAFAVNRARENVQRNAVDNVVKIKQGSFEDALTEISTGKYGEVDLIAANLVAMVIPKLLKGEIVETLAPRGILIISGFRDNHTEEIEIATRKIGLSTVGRNQIGEWVVIIARKEIAG